MLIAGNFVGWSSGLKTVGSIVRAMEMTIQ